MKSFFRESSLMNHPIRLLMDFLEKEKNHENGKLYRNQRFVGYALNISYDTVTMITSDPYKLAVGGIPRNSFLIMVPESFEEILPHFAILRVLETTETPLSRDVQQTYFELQKRSMPELDIFTQSELQWSALKVEILGMFYPEGKKLEFAADLNNYISAHKYRIYSPDEELLNQIINNVVPEKSRFVIGKLRLTENRLTFNNHQQPDVDVMVSTRDFLGARTALFGKTRLGKSNTIKIIVESVIATNPGNVGQLVFDVNGEYANDNPQNIAISTMYPKICEVYSIASRTGAKPLRLNFYEFPARGHQILGQLITNDRKDKSNYVKVFISAEVPSVEELNEIENPGDRKRAIRRVLMYWAILYKAGFNPDLGVVEKTEISPADFQLNRKLRELLHDGDPPEIRTFGSLLNELKLLAHHIKSHGVNHESLRSSGSGNPLFDSDDEALLLFLYPRTGAGTKLLQPYRMYHDASAGDFVDQIIKYLEEGKTVILDLGNAHPMLLQYYSEYLSKAIFAHQLDKFSRNKLEGFVQLYFEEAHNLFPNTETSEVSIYRRLAKEGAKYHIGMVYSTQSVSTIHPDLLAQTENFFIAHMSSEQETSALARVNVEFNNCRDDILRLRRPGYVRMLTRSHRFMVPVQIKEFGRD